MSFTDEDVKRLKEVLGDGDPIFYSGPEILLPRLKINFNRKLSLQALLARLEAAEETICCSIGTSARYHSFQDAYEAWRKACGK